MRIFYPIVIIIFKSYIFKNKVNEYIIHNYINKNLEGKKIPKVIHKIIITDDFLTPIFTEEINNAINSFKEMNNDYIIKIYNRNDCLRYIEKYYSIIEKTIFENLIPHAYKCDFMRYLILYNEGGIYSDMKMICLKPFKDIFPHDTQWFSAKDLEPNKMANGFIMSIKGHPILNLAIEKVKYNFIKKDKGYDSLSPTGPVVLDYAFEKYRMNNCLDKILIGKHKKDEENKLYFYDHKGEKFIKTKFVRQDGKEFSSASWDILNNIKGNNYNILWKRDKVFRDDYSLLYGDNRFRLFFVITIYILFKIYKKSKLVN